jgi:preprotein translocase subunit YajC
MEGEMHPLVGFVVSWVPFLILVACLYFFLLRPIHKLSATINRLAEAIEKRGA